MNNAELILQIQEEYGKRSRNEILTNLKIGMLLGENKGLKVNRQEVLPNITNKSKHTVASWFCRPDKKIPLIDLCIIAKYLKYNIFTFFNIKENGVVDISDFLMANDKFNEIYPPDGAEIYVKASDMQYNTDKNIILDNIEKYYGSTEELLLHHLDKRQKRIMEVCNCNLHSYYSWFNRSRTNVKIPLLSLCRLAIDAGVDVFDLLTE